MKHIPIYVRYSILSAILAGSSVLPAQTASLDTPAGESVVLDPFTVHSDQDRGYRKNNSVTTSRIGIPLDELPQNVQVISSEMLSDLNVTRADDVFRYSASVTATQNETGQGNLFMLRGFDMPRYYNGVSQANSNSIYGEFTTDNIERVELAKGAVGLFYGNSSPNGVANYITKKPQFVNRSELLLAGGSYNYMKALADVQGVGGAKREFAYRVIASATQREARVNDQRSDTLFIAPSFTYAPTKWLRVDAEYNGTKFGKPYGSLNTTNAAINPRYYQDITNPSQDILNYMKTTYGLADDAAARAKVAERWATPRWATYLNNWSADTYAMTGIEPFLQTGSTISWDRLSPQGDKWNGVSPEANQDGYSHLGDASITLTPIEGLAVKYRWLHQETKQNFVRMLYLPNGGLTADGRVPTMSATGISLTTDEKRQGFADTQQLDASYEFDLGSVENTVTGGLESRRNKSQFGGAPANTALAGSSTYLDYNPFTQPDPGLYALQVGPTPITARFLFEYEDYYASHRAKALNGRLNTMIGYRHVEDTNLHQSDGSLSYGAIFEIRKGLSVFASTSNTFVFSNAYNIQGTGVTPEDNARILDPEDGTSWEFGVKTDWRDGQLSGTASIFQIERNGVVTTDFDGNSKDPRNNDLNPNNDVRYLRNGGLQRGEGADFDLIWTPDSKLQVVLNYVYLWEAATLTDPSVDMTKTGSRTYRKIFNYRLAKSPEHQASLVAKYNFTDGGLKGLSLGSGLRYNTDYQYNAGTGNDLVVPSELLIDLFATYSALKLAGNPVDIQVNVTNVTNEINDITRGNGVEFGASVRFRF